MTTHELRDPLAVASQLLGAAYRQALAAARANPDSTWIDAASAIGAAEAQLHASAGLAVDQAEARPPEGTCSQLLEAAEQALHKIPAGEGPVSLALVRSYLTEAILETTGRDQ